MGVGVSGAAGLALGAVPHEYSKEGMLHDAASTVHYLLYSRTLAQTRGAR